MINYSILKGNMLITDNIETLRNINLGPTLRIIDMDDDEVLPDTPDIIKGQILLPPIEAKIAEADGNEMLFDDIYSKYLLSPPIQEYLSALFSYLYIGGNLLFYLPQLDYTNTMSKFLYFMNLLYGIHIGYINNPDPFISSCSYNLALTPTWAMMIYGVDVIDAYEFLRIYPEDADLWQNKNALNKALKEINPYGETLKDKYDYILHLHKLIHKNPNVKPAIVAVRKFGDQIC